ncbi:MAG: DUF192 domain-containing protein [Nitrospinota bacterium]
MRILEEGAVNRSTDRRLADMVLQAGTFFERLRGLLGRSGLATGEALLLDPCRAVHTAGMRFPIDILFLDRSGRVVGVAQRVPPNRVLVAAGRTRRVLELPAGVIESTRTSVGHQILLGAGGEGGAPPRLEHWHLNFFLALLFGTLAAANLSHFFSVPTVGGAALFLINGLSALLFCLRREPIRATRKSSHWGLTLSTLIIPWGLRAMGTHAGPLPLAGGLLEGAGLLIVLCGLLSLGRSFGLAPADRGLVEGGLYRWMRHPMYTGELLFFLGFGLENPLAWNGILLLALFIGLPLRALVEERFLVSDSRYRAYMERVRGRFIPGIL